MHAGGLIEAGPHKFSSCGFGNGFGTGAHKFSSCGFGTAAHKFSSCGFGSGACWATKLLVRGRVNRHLFISLGV